MSQAELNRLIEKIQKELASWGHGVTVPYMRESWERLFTDIRERAPVTRTPVSANGVDGEWLDAPGARRDRAVLYLHGGGYVLGSVNSHRDMIARLSAASGARALGLNYRLAPENPFPAAVDDAVAGYRFLLEQGITPARIAIAGDSAGGGLATATLVALKERGLPRPAAGILLSPWVDLEGVGESMNGGVADDPMVSKDLVGVMGPAYLAGADVRTPLAAPLYADLRGLPPLYIQVGRREVLLDDALRLAQNAQRARVEVTLEVWPGMIHVWQIFASELSEAREAIERIGEYLRKRFD
jgi:acetyl esterase/lipase